MKKRFIIIFTGLVIFFTVIAFQYSDDAKTIEAAVETAGPEHVDIIHIEESNQGYVVFSLTSSSTLYTAIIEDTFGGFKTVYDGVQGDIELVSETLGLSYTYLPAIENTPLPIYFGLIGHPDIHRITITEEKRKIEREAQIIQTDTGHKIWLVYMSDFEGSDFDISGFSEEGEVITEIDGNISPYYAEQKPFEGYN